MSVDATTWVWRHSEARGNDRLVLLAIADHAWSDGTHAFPSQARIAEMTRLSESTVRRSIRTLRDLGELVVQLGGGPSSVGPDGRPRATNSYRMTLTTTGGQSDHPSGGAEEAETGGRIDPRSDRPGVNSGGTGGQIRPDGWSRVTAKPSTNPRRNPRARDDGEHGRRRCRRPGHEHAIPNAAVGCPACKTEGVDSWESVS